MVEADESVFFLMATRISELRDAPVFFYGQPYLGSLNEYLAAAFMRVGGSTPASGRALSLVLALVLVVLSYRLGCVAAGRRAGWLAGLYAALAPALLVIYGARLWAYIDIVVLGSILFLHVLSPRSSTSRTASGRFGWWLTSGFLIGLGLWCHVLFIVYAVSVLVFGLMRGIRRDRGPTNAGLATPLLGGALGFCIGALPLLLYNALHPGATLAPLTRAADAGAGLVTRIASASYNLIAVGLPSVLGTLLPWRAFRTEMSVMLTPAAAALVGAVLGLLFLVATVVLAWPSRPRSGTGATAATPKVGGGLVALAFAGAFVLAVPLLVAWNGGPVRDLGLDPRVPSGALDLIVHELRTPAVLALLLWLPAAAAVGARLRQRSRAPVAPDPAPAAAADRPADAAGADAVSLMLIHVAVCCLAYILTSYGLARSPRFLLPLFSSLPVLFAVGVLELNLRFRHAGTVWAAGILAVNLAVQLASAPELALQPPQYAGRISVPPSYAGLAARLEALGYRHVYAPYWTGFPLVWASHERIAVSSAGEGKLPVLDRAVAGATRVAFLFYRDKLDDRFFRQLLARAGMPATVEEAGPFRIYCGVDVEALRHSALWPAVQVILSHP